MRPDIRDGLAANGLSQVLIAPLRTSGQVVGLLGLGWRGEPRPLPLDRGRSGTPPSSSARASRTPTSSNGSRQPSNAERRLADEESALQTLTLIAEQAGAFDELAATDGPPGHDAHGRRGRELRAPDADDRVVHSASIGVDREFIDARHSTSPPAQMASVQRLLAGSGPYITDYVDGAVQRGTLSLASGSAAGRSSAWCRSRLATGSRR